MDARSYTPHYTTADYETWAGDWELWQGVPVSMSPSPTFRHQKMLSELSRQLGNQLADQDGCHCTVVVEHDWRIADDHIVRPDLMIVCDGFDGPYLDRPPTLTAEVLSPATAHKDRTAKRELYAQQGVRGYLLVDPDTGRIKTLGHTEGALEPLTPSSPEGPTPLTLHPGCDLQIPAALA